MKKESSVRDLKPTKVTKDSDIVKDFKAIIKRSPLITNLKIVNDIEGLPSDLLTLDTSYSTRLGYDRAAMLTTLQVMCENVTDDRINKVFNTSYSKEQLVTAELHILAKSIKLKSEKIYTTSGIKPDFIDVFITFMAGLRVNGINPGLNQGI